MSESTTSQFKAAAAQMTSGDDLLTNLATCRDLAKKAGDQGVRLLVLPECFAFIGERLADKFTIAEAIDESAPGPILAALVEIAMTNKLWLIAGGMPERVDDELDLAPSELSRAYNTALVLNPEGQISHRYRKIHLFDIAIPGRAEFRESDSTAPGTEVAVAETELANIGLSICYDLRFPELYRQMALNHGAEIIVVPAAFTAHTGAAHWHTLLRARAIENQCYVIAAGQAGRHNDKRESYGRSLIIDPWGTVIAERETGTGLAIAEIETSAVEKTRQEMPCLEHQVIEIGG